MAWLTILGGGIGFFLGGPVGAVIGAGLGGAADGCSSAGGSSDEGENEESIKKREEGKAQAKRAASARKQIHEHVKAGLELSLKCLDGIAEKDGDIAFNHADLRHFSNDIIQPPCSPLGVSVKKLGYSNEDRILNSIGKLELMGYFSTMRASVQFDADLKKIVSLRREIEFLENVDKNLS